MEQIIKELKDKLNKEKVLIGVSCGIDSTVLLDLLEKSIDHDNIYIAHINHHVRKESDIEEEYLINYCKEHHLKLFIKHLDKINNNFEENARKARYDFFYQVASNNNIKYILLAHHALDNLETMIMRFLRSSNLKAYGGMEKEAKYHDKIIYRPLLNIDKEDIILYAKKRKLKYFHDYTNDEDDHMRNRIRHKIIPILKEENPNLINAINNYSNTLINSGNYLLEEVHNYINNNFIVNNNELIFSIDKLQSKSLFFQKQALFEALKPFQLTNKEVDEIIKNIYNNNKKIIYQINNELNFIKEYNNIIITTTSLIPLEFNLTITKEGSYKLPNNQIIEVQKNICYLSTNNEKLCYNIDGFPITIRTRLNSDYLMKKKKDKETNQIIYYKQSLSNYLTNKKVPTLLRNNLLYLVNSNNEIIYILGNKKLNI